VQDLEADLLFVPDDLVQYLLSIQGGRETLILVRVQPTKSFVCRNDDSLLLKAVFDSLAHGIPGMT
jgi:hypothetical protein